jgi:hypothetical protein
MVNNVGKPVPESRIKFNSAATRKYPPQAAQIIMLVSSTNTSRKNPAISSESEIKFIDFHNNLS